MRKKLVTLLTVTALVLSVGMNVQAAGNPANITSPGGSASAEVKGHYESSTLPAETVYKVDVAWGSLEFIYKAGVRKWNAQIHKYEVGTEGKWEVSDAANKISITNHSNAKLDVTVKAEIGTSYGGITASVIGEEGDGGTVKEQGEDKSTVTLILEDASNNATTELPGTPSTASAAINLSGKLASDTANNTPIGNVTVSIADAKTE